MISKSLITAIIFCLLPAATAFGQVLKKEQLKGTNSSNSGANYAVFYASGIPESAIWPLGMNLMANNATIRHTHSGGNGSNISVNDKVPFRFIIAPQDGLSGEVNWAVAMGLNTTANNDLGADGTGESTGCTSYSTPEFLNGWRLPTQREMMLMWLFREGIDAIYGNALLQEAVYWTATEYDNDEAWMLNFSSTAPESNTSGKITTYRYRCVRDY